MNKNLKFEMLDGSYKIGSIIDTQGFFDVKWCKIQDKHGNIISINMSHVLYVVEYNDDLEVCPQL